ncbi:MAG: hypothetical protein ACO1RX_12535 [Candidatus Sericytochromatia bacterium]
MTQPHTELDADSNDQEMLDEALEESFPASDPISPGGHSEPVQPEPTQAEQAEAAQEDEENLPSPPGEGTPV